ncbi:MAG: metal ABC transporter substrate-binding protein [Puniceicoccaceae bacterium]
MKLRLFISLLFAATLLHAEPLKVGVSVLPLESVVKEIGGERVEVMSLQREGDSCSVFEPRPSVISWLAGAEVFFRVGAGYETSILHKVENRFDRLTVHDLRDVVSVLPLEEHDHHHHDHAHAHDHGEDCESCGSVHGDGDEETDPHLWLDPLRLADAADLIAGKLAEALPESAEVFRDRAQSLRRRAEVLHHKLEQQLHPFHGRAFYVYHPSLNYFAQRYDLEQVAISAPSHSPTVRELHGVISRAREEGVRVIFVQPQESRRHAEIVAQAVGASVVEIDPMDPDWEQCIGRIGEELAKAFMQD